MITLESTKIAFDTWRTTRAHNNTPTPTKLWVMVGRLLLTHKKPEICNILRISNTQIKKHCVAIPTIKDKKSQPAGNDFVEAVPLPTVGMSELTFSGSSKSLHLRLPTAALREVLPILGELL